MGADFEDFVRHPATDLRGAVVETFNGKGALVGTAPLTDGPAPRDEVDRWDG